jgi:hypothetical protein
MMKRIPSLFTALAGLENGTTGSDGSGGLCSRTRARLAGPFHLLYVLHTTRTKSELGWYEGPRKFLHFRCLTQRKPKSSAVYEYHPMRKETLEMACPAVRLSFGHLEPLCASQTEVLADPSAVVLNKRQNCPVPILACFPP